jgi:hypothetical protein
MHEYRLKCKPPNVRAVTMVASDAVLSRIGTDAAGYLNDQASRPATTA